MSRNVRNRILGPIPSNTHTHTANRWESRQLIPLMNVKGQLWCYMFFFKEVSLYISNWTRTEDLTASVSQTVGLQDYSTMPGLLVPLFKHWKVNLKRYSTAELYSQSFNYFETVSLCNSDWPRAHCVTQASLELMVILLLPSSEYLRLLKAWALGSAPCWFKRLFWSGNDVFKKI